MDDAIEDALFEDRDVDVLDVQLVGVRCLPDADPFVDDLPLLDAADVLDDLVVCDDLL